MNYYNNYTYSHLIDENFFLKIGSSWLLDSIYLVVISPLSMIGFALNLISYFTFLKIKLKETKLYKYLKVYTLSSSLICFMLGFIFITYSPRYFKDFYHPIVKFYRCRIVSYAVLCLFFFNNLLDILINIERISIFTDRFNFHRNVNPYKLSTILVVICFVINSPFIFTYEMTSDEIYFNQNVFNYCTPNEFGKSRLGIWFNMSVIVIRDVITLILEIIASLILIYFYQRYFNNFSSSYYNMSYNVNDDITTFSFNKTNGSIYKRENLESKIKYMKQKGRKLLVMTLILSFFSIITHLLSAIIFVFVINSLGQNRFLHFSLVCLCCLCLAFKHSLNFFIFYIFNSNFQKKISKLFFLSL